MSLSLTKAVLSKYINPVFVETGTYHGGGVQLALECGFEKIHSIEIYEPFYQSAIKRFKEDIEVLIWYGDSLEVLPRILASITQPATFFLDSHTVEQTREMGWVTELPLLKELVLIEQHAIKTHTILIDDKSMLGGKKPKGGWISREWQKLEESQLIDMLYRINPQYKITYEDSAVEKDDIIVARIE